MTASAWLASGAEGSPVNAITNEPARCRSAAASTSGVLPEFEIRTATVPARGSLGDESEASSAAASRPAARRRAAASRAANLELPMPIRRQRG